MDANRARRAALRLVWLALCLALLVLLVSPSSVFGHGDDMDDDDEPPKPKGGGGMKPMDGMNNEEEEDPVKAADVRRKKRKVMMIFHAVLASGVVWITMPISIALVSGKKMELHRNMSSVNTLAMMFIGLLAVLGFADGESWHAKIAFLCLGAWAFQAGYGWIRHFWYKTSMPIKPHRFFGIALAGITMIAWASGVLHVMGSCNAAEDVQMCNAHFFLGALFVLVGLANGYYSPEFAAKVEMCLAAFGGISELVGEGAVDSILNAIDPQTFVWDHMAKMVHLTTAAIWVACAFVGWAIAVRRPSTLQRGIALWLGILFHLIFMFSHGDDASPRTKAAHLLHELALIPVLITRPTARLPKVTSYLLTVSGFGFVFAADPITRDAGSIEPFPYVLMIAFYASIFHAVHGYIRMYILRKEPSETMLERTGWAQPVYCFLGCLGRIFCCCPALQRDEIEVLPLPGGKTKYQHLETNGTVEEETKLQDIDEDVTSAPPI